MEISQKLLGFLRTLASVAVWGAILAVLSYFSDATHLALWMNQGLATVIAGYIGALEHKYEAEDKGSLFGAVKVRRN